MPPPDPIFPINLPSNAILQIPLYLNINTIFLHPIAIPTAVLILPKPQQRLGGIRTTDILFCFEDFSKPLLFQVEMDFRVVWGGWGEGFHVVEDWGLGVWVVVFLVVELCGVFCVFLAEEIAEVLFYSLFLGFGAGCLGHFFAFSMGVDVGQGRKGFTLFFRTNWKLAKILNPQKAHRGRRVSLILHFIHLCLPFEYTLNLIPLNTETDTKLSQTPSSLPRLKFLIAHQSRRLHNNSLTLNLIFDNGFTFLYKILFTIKMKILVGLNVYEQIRSLKLIFANLNLGRLY